jgi:hypothetical protein
MTAPWENSQSGQESGMSSSRAWSRGVQIEIQIFGGNPVF